MKALEEIEEKKIEEEEITQKINAINDLEKLDPYPHYLARDDYWERIERACQYIPSDYRYYALALFANVIYIPSIILDEAWRYGLRELNRLYGLNEENLLNEALLLEGDSGLIRRFCHSNNIKGRLDFDKQPRSSRIGDLAKDYLLSRCNISKELKDRLDKEVSKFLERRFWILLVDNALSGTSLSSELNRILKLSEITNPEAEIIVLVQIMTSDASKKVEDEIKNKTRVKIIRAIYLDEKFKINSENCQLFKSKDTLKGVQKLCEWFANEILSKDKNYDSTRNLSGGDLRYGFKNSGLTLVTPNCPSNSVPLLWYYRPPYYEGPYPRVESRITQTRSLDQEIVDYLYESTKRGSSDD